MMQPPTFAPLPETVVAQLNEISTATKWSKKGNTYTFKEIPVYDVPIPIADKSLIQYR